MNTREHSLDLSAVVFHLDGFRGHETDARQRNTRQLVLRLIHQQFLGIMGPPRNHGLRIFI